MLRTTLDADQHGSYIGSRDLSGQDLSGYDFRNALMQKVDLRNANLTGANLTGANLSKAKLQGATFENARLTDASLWMAYADGANFRHATFGGKADISFAAMNGADLTGADLSRTKAMGTVFKDADLTGADLSRADLDGAELATAKTMEGVKVSGRELMASDLGDDVAMLQDNAGGTAHRSRPPAGGPKVGRPLTKLPRASWKKRDSNTWLAATDEYWLAVDRVKGPVNGPQWAYRLRHGARGSEGMDDGQTYETLDAAKRAGFHARGRGPAVAPAPPAPPAKHRNFEIVGPQGKDKSMPAKPRNARGGGRMKDTGSASTIVVRGKGSVG